MKKLYISQYGERFYASTRKELTEQLSGRVYIMYRDMPDGSVARCGYVIGNRWLREYTPVLREVTK